GCGASHQLSLAPPPPLLPPPPEKSLEEDESDDDDESDVLAALEVRLHDFARDPFRHRIGEHAFETVADFDAHLAIVYEDEKEHAVVAAFLSDAPPKLAIRTRGMAIRTREMICNRPVFVCHAPVIVCNGPVFICNGPVFICNRPIRTREMTIRTPEPAIRMRKLPIRTCDLRRVTALLPRRLLAERVAVREPPRLESAAEPFDALLR